ncbi:GAF domain-containing SpoIIE family protein phosphatase [Dactylosporangium sp. NPDC049742]|uniref:PP2C family protein-serine/threonine phosphatase n=1 Tax=Dactylosporangium sp. NPDC049742 TaxID=3154737 RepID=UPI00343ABD3C
MTSDLGFVGRAPDSLNDAGMLAVAQRRAQFLADASRTVSGSLNLPHTVRRSLAACVPHLADWAQIMLIGRDGASYTSLVVNKTGTSSAARRHPDADGVNGQSRLLVTGRPELLHVSLEQDPLQPDGLLALVPDERMRAQVAALRPADVLGLPLTARGTTFGTLTLARRTGFGFVAEDISIAEELAVRIALALDAARRYAERAGVATVLQASLRPPELPKLEGSALAARYRAASTDAEIGGDFYDVWGSPDDWSFVLGDVSGKGVEAAVVTGQARHTVRGASAVDRDPAAVLRALNTMLDGSTSGRYVTAVYGRVRRQPCGALHVRVASAGHPPPLAVRACGSVEPVAVRGLAAGLVAGVEYTPAEVTLSPGDTLVLYTDGVTEARHHSVRDGTRRLAELLSQYAQVGVDALVEAVEIAVLEGSDGTQRDDLAVLALRAAVS